MSSTLFPIFYLRGKAYCNRVTRSHAVLRVRDAGVVSEVYVIR